MTASRVISRPPGLSLDAPKPGRRRSAGNLVLPASVGGAGFVHLALTPEHFEEGPQFRLFFLAAAGAATVLLWWIAPVPGRGPASGAATAREPGGRL